MGQSEPNLRDYWWIVRRRKWLVLVVPLILGPATYVTGLLQAPPPLYRATAVARFERSFNVNTLLMRDIVSVSPVGDLETNAALVKSNPVLLRAARRLGVLPASTTLEEVQASPAHQATLQQLGSSVEVTRTAGTSLIEITATTGDPGSAARTANSVAEAFQENDVDTRTRQIVEARRFIEAQLEEVGGRLRESEERLRTFQEKNKVLLLTEETRATLNRLGTHEAEREKLERDIRAAEVELRQLSRADADAGVGAGGDPQIAKLQAALSDLTLERETLLLTLRPAHPQVRALEARIENVRRELHDTTAANRARQAQAIRAQLLVLQARRTQVTSAVVDLTAKTAAMPAVALEAGRLEREVKVNERIFSLLKERLQEALIKEKEQTAEVSVVRPALASRVPVNSPQATQRGLVGILLGVVIGLVFAFIAEALDTSIGAIQDLEALLESPILGVIPHLDPKLMAEHTPEGEVIGALEGADDRLTFLPTVFAPRSPMAEAVRGLRTNLLLRILDRDVKTLVVTSAAQGEGKTTLALNLALVMAQLGKRTLLVESDLRNPSIRHMLGIRRDPGVVEVVLGSVSLEDAALNFADLMLGKSGMESLLDAPGIDNFFVLPSGRRAPNPSELMSSNGFAQLLAEARERYDCVILDSAPVLSVADASVLASQSDGILCVVRVGHVPRAALRRAKSIMDGIKAPLIGVCLNGVKAEVSPDFQELSYYKYHYGPKPTAPRRRQLSDLWKRPDRRTREAVRAGLTLLAVGVGTWGVASGVAWGVSRAAASFKSPASAAALSPERAPRLDSPSAAPAPAPVVAPPPSYSVEVPLGAEGSGQVLVGQFASAEEAVAFGEDLVRGGVTERFRVVRAGGS
jgi:polysaccharide biosynthesis transport protein